MLFNKKFTFCSKVIIKKIFFLVGLFFGILFCSSKETKVTRNSTADEIIDESAEKIYFFLIENYKVIKNQRLKVLNFEIFVDGQMQKNSVLGELVKNSVIGYLGRNKEVRILISGENDSENDDEYDYALSCIILVRDKTLAFSPRIFSRSNQILHSTVFVMPKNERIMQYVYSHNNEQKQYQPPPNLIIDEEFPEEYIEKKF